MLKTLVYKSVFKLRRGDRGRFEHGVVTWLKTEKLYRSYNSKDEMHHATIYYVRKNSRKKKIIKYSLEQ